jgi:putative oxidoreductase
MIQSLSRWGLSLEKGWSLPLLIMRLVLAYGFFHAAKMKWTDINAIVAWFREAKFPLPLISAYLVASFEALGTLLLILGLFTRLITIPLMFILLVAIFAVHWPNGFEAGDNGFEIPLYYLVMLFTLFIMGPGIISVDQTMLGKKSRK